MGSWTGPELHGETTSLPLQISKFQLKSDAAACPAAAKLSFLIIVQAESCSPHTLPLHILCSSPGKQGWTHFLDHEQILMDALMGFKISISECTLCSHALVNASITLLEPSFEHLAKAASWFNVKQYVFYQLNHEHFRASLSYLSAFQLSLVVLFHQNIKYFTELFNISVWAN